MHAKLIVFACMNSLLKSHGKRANQYCSIKRGAVSSTSIWLFLITYWRNYRRGKFHLHANQSAVLSVQWTDLCKYYRHLRTTSIGNAWRSSSGPLLQVHSLFLQSKNTTDDEFERLEMHQVLYLPWSPSF